MGTSTGGVCRFVRGSDDFDVFRHDAEDPTSLRYNGILSMQAGKDGAVWVGTDRGLDRFNPETGAFEHAGHDGSDPLSITALYVDRNDILWVGTAASGLFQYNVRRKKFDIHDSPHDSPQVDAMLEARDGALWIGTAAGGLERIDPSGERQHWGKNELGSNVITGLAEASDGTVWVGAFGGGVSSIARGGAVRTFAHDAQDTTSISSNEVTCIAIDRQGQVWCGDRRRLCLAARPGNGDRSHSRGRWIPGLSARVRAIARVGRCDVGGVVGRGRRPLRHGQR